MPYVVVNGWRNENGEQIVYLARAEDPKTIPPFEWVAERSRAKQFDDLPTAEKFAAKYGGAVLYPKEK